MTPREVVEAWVAAFNRRDADAAAALYHDDAVNIQVAEGTPTVGRRAMRDGFAYGPFGLAGGGCASRCGGRVALRSVLDSVERAKIA